MIPITFKLNTSRKLLFFFILTSFACNKANESVKSTNTLFKKLSETTTGVDFVNVMKETDEVNVLTYQYIYNGSGVAVLDINNDGLHDLFFTSNQGDCKLYLNKGNLKFEDITQQAGISTSSFCIGTTTADVNNDGFMDIYVCRSNPYFSDEERENLLFVNQGDNTFKELGKEYGINDNGNTSMASFLDIDNDGDLDLYVGNHPADFESDIRKRSCYELYTEKESDQLYENLGNGKFKKITSTAGVGNYAFTLSIAVTDFNHDGYSDIYVCNDYYGPDFCYINQGNNTFKETHKEYFKKTSTNAMGSDAADFNNDGLVDLLVLDMLPNDNYRRKLLSGPSNFDLYILRLNTGYGHQSMKNTLQWNRGNGKFSEIAALSGIEATDWSWAPLMADYDNDGWKDIYITNGYYRDVTNLDFVNYEANFMQKNNRRMKIEEMAKILPNKRTDNYAFKNNRDLTFENVSTKWGLNDATVSNGAAYVDLDNDGDLDLIACNMNEKSYIYENTSKKNNYLQLQLEGEKNKFGIGTKAKLHTNEGIQYAENYTSRGYNSAVWPVLHFGLGEASMDSLEIWWPSGKYTVAYNLQKNKRLTFKEADAQNSAPTSKLPNNQLFTEVTNKYAAGIRHYESAYIDFKREPLLPKMLSKRGPDIAIADINKDGLEDFILAGSTISTPQMYVQTSNGNFKKTNGPWDNLLAEEQTALHFFDANGDGWPDLYIGNGSIEYDNISDPSYQDKLFINNKGTWADNSDALPSLAANTGAVVSHDIDGDGDLDLIIGGHVIPGLYPKTNGSRILENKRGIFTDATAKWLPEAANWPMVNDMTVADLNNDDKKELIVAGEWHHILVYEWKENKWIDQSAKYNTESAKGWWRAIHCADINNDGFLDIIAGNEGLNSQFRASETKPLVLDYGDIDGDGSFEGLVSQYYGDILAPIYPKMDLSDKLRYFTNTHYKFFEDYAKSNTEDLLSKGKKTEGRLIVNELRSVIFASNNGKFTLEPLPLSAQIAPLFGFYNTDLNNDGKQEILGVGNAQDNKIELGWADALNGIVLQQVNGQWIELNNTGFLVPKNGKKIKPIIINGKKHVIVTQTGDAIKIYAISEKPVL